MLLQALVLVAPFVGAVAGHDHARRHHNHHNHLARALSASAPPSVTAGTTTPAVQASALSTAPGAVPVASILSSMPPQPTVPLPITPTAGAVPSSIPSAPPLPDLSAWDASVYPPLDKPPPIDSPEVQAWLAEVKASGVEIPTFAPMKTGDCAANPERVGNLTECWWTCGHCTRTTDVTTCQKPLTWGSSFDDGPSPDTPDLLQYLLNNSLTTTFFVVGSRVAMRPQFVQSQYMLGHQIAVHTWSHTELTTQTTEEIVAEFGWSRKVIFDAIGVTPNFMRPPYGDIDDRVRAIAIAMGMTPVIWTVGSSGPFDTFDWEVPGGVVSAAQAINQFETILQSAKTLSTGFIVLEHDLYPQTVDLAVGYFLPSALAEHLTIEPIVTCMGLQPSDAYVETNNNATHPPPYTDGGAPVSANVSSEGGASTSRAGAWVGALVAGVLGLAGLL